jgi:hypothetical protein
MTDDSADWDEIGALERVARAGSHEIRTILLENAPLWALIARAIETRRYEGYMGAPRIRMASGFTFGPEEIMALASKPDRWTEPHPLRPQP